MRYNYFDMLPERAFLKVGGKIMPQGGGSSAPTSTTVQNTSIPEYAKPYVESTLGKAAAVTDLTNNPYQPYKGQQIAQFTPMQNQAFQNVGSQQLAPQIADASNIAYQTGQYGLGTQGTAAQLQNASLGYGTIGNQAAQQNAGIANLYGDLGNQIAQQNAGMANQYAGQGAQGAFENANMSGLYGAQGQKSGQKGQNLGVQGGRTYGGMGAGYGSQGAGLANQSIGTGQAGMQAGMGYGQAAQNPGAVQNYMNPYLQASLQPALQEVQRQYDITGAQQMGNASRSGAFGGSREALMAAENQRNKNIAMNQMIGQGYNQAYNTANANMQQAAALGMQGAQSGLAGLNAANQNYATGIQGAQAGLQGVNAQLAGTAQGMQGSQVGLQGANQAGQLSTAGGQLGMQGAVGAGNLGLAGTGQGMQASQIAGQLGVSGANAGMQGVQGAVGAGQYGLQGLGQAGAAAGTLGQLGQTQFGQEQAANQAMVSAGTQQQALQQKGLDAAYQQYQAQLNYPYQQIGFMSDLLRGLPLTQQSQSMYQNPSMISQAAGIGTAGMGLYGMNKMMNAKGGQIKEQRMADGGITQLFDVGGSVKTDLSRMSPQDLQEYIAESSSPTAKRMAQQILAEKTFMARLQQNPGVTQLPSNLPTGEAMAGGGIIAFAEGDQVESSDSSSSLSGDTRVDAESRADAEAYYQRLIAGAGEGDNIRAIPGSEMAQAGIANDANTVAIPVAASAPTTGAPLPPAQTGGINNLVAQPPTRLPAAGATPATVEKTMYGNMPLMRPEAKEAFSQYAQLYKDMRGDNKKAREEAKWMALMQAGFGIAGGTSPNAFANINQGVQPAMAQYQSAIKDIRKDDREAVKGLIDLGLTKEKFMQEAEKMGIDLKKAQMAYDSALDVAKLNNAGRLAAATAGRQPKSVTSGDIQSTMLGEGIVVDTLKAQVAAGKPLTPEQQARLNTAQSNLKYYSQFQTEANPPPSNLSGVAATAEAETKAIFGDPDVLSAAFALKIARASNNPTKIKEAETNLNTAKEAARAVHRENVDIIQNTRSNRPQPGATAGDAKGAGGAGGAGANNFIVGRAYTSNGLTKVYKGKDRSNNDIWE